MNHTNYPMRHKHKRYKSHLKDAAIHNQSIITKYGMPPKAQPPKLPDDILEKVIEAKVTPRRWNRYT